MNPERKRINSGPFGTICVTGFKHVLDLVLNVGNWVMRFQHYSVSFRVQIINITVCLVVVVNTFYAFSF